MTDRAGSPTGDEARRRLHELTVRDSPLADRIDQVLALGVEYLGVENGHVAEIDFESGQWEAIASTDSPDGTLPEGHVRALANSYCRHVVEREHPFAVHDVRDHGLADDPAHEQTELSCYHGAAIVVDDEIFGTVCFASHDRRSEPFTDEEKLFVDLASTLLGHAIQRTRNRRRVSEQRAALARQREQFRSLLSANFDVVLRLDRAGTITEVAESDRMVLGYPVDELLGTNYSELMANQASFETATQAIDRVLGGEPVEELSLDVLTCDGDALLMDIRAAPIYERDPSSSDTEFVEFERGHEIQRLFDDQSETAVAGDRSESDAIAGSDADVHWTAETSLDGEEPGEQRVTAVHVVLRDASQRQRYEHLVSVLQRVLRHNVRNSLNVIYGSADEIADSGTVESGPLETIRETCLELLSLTEKAGKLESAVAELETPVAVDLTAVARRVTDRVGERYPDASISVTASDSGNARGTYGLEQAVEEVVENAAKHAGDAPTVTVTVERRDDDVVVEVADDGPGLPPQERGVLTSGEETPLEHGSGLGHWFVYWIVTSLDGTVDAMSGPSGTVVTLSLPAASAEATDEPLDSA